jgi:hypothetical protein
MRKSRTVVLSLAMGVVALGSSAIPVAAANPRLAFVNGIPGKTVDVCVGDTEIKSGLRYGRWFDHTFAPGERRVKFRNASPGTCKGKTLARRTYELEADVDGTIVATAEAPKLVDFDNTLSPAPVGNVNWVAARHAADLGAAVITQHVGFAISPSAVPVPFEKGDSWRDTFGTSTLAMLFAAYRPAKGSPFLGPGEVLTYSGRRSEIILVGTRPSNARFVTIMRPTIAP